MFAGQRNYQIKIKEKHKVVVQTNSASESHACITCKAQQCQTV